MIGRCIIIPTGMPYSATIATKTGRADLVHPLFGADTAHYSTVQYYVKLYGSSDHDVSRLRTSKGEVSQLIAHVLLASNKLSS